MLVYLLIPWAVKQPFPLLSAAIQLYLQNTFQTPFIILSLVTSEFTLCLKDMTTDSSESYPTSVWPIILSPAEVNSGYLGNSIRTGQVHFKFLSASGGWGTSWTEAYILAYNRPPINFLHNWKVFLTYTIFLIIAKHRLWEIISSLLLSMNLSNVYLLNYPFSLSGPWLSWVCQFALLWDVPAPILYLCLWAAELTQLKLPLGCWQY